MVLRDFLLLLLGADAAAGTEQMQRETREKNKVQKGNASGVEQQ
jgi:hypothetical protein